MLGDEIEKIISYYLCHYNLLTQQLEPNQKEWIYKTAIGDLDSVTRLLLQDRTLVKYKDFISGYTGMN